MHNMTESPKKISSISKHIKHFTAFGNCLNTPQMLRLLPRETCIFSNVCQQNYCQGKIILTTLMEHLYFHTCPEQTPIIVITINKKEN